MHSGATTWHYDAVGNRTGEQGTDTNGVSTVSRLYSYNVRNELTGITDNRTPANSISYTYDANGNQTGKTQGTLNWTYGYDARDELTGITQTDTSSGSPVTTTVGQYRYDADGLRTDRQSTATGSEHYTWDDHSLLLTFDDAGTYKARYRYGPMRLESLNTGSGAVPMLSWYFFDALGSVTDVLGNSGSLDASYRYDAWGRQTVATGASVNQFGFTGHQRDAESGLSYFKARFYDPDVGRFLTEDSYEGHQDTPPSLHRYLYAYDNPEIYIDPTGHIVILDEAERRLDQFDQYLANQTKQYGDTGFGRVMAGATGVSRGVLQLGKGALGVANVAGNTVALAGNSVGLVSDETADNAASDLKQDFQAAKALKQGIKDGSLRERAAQTLSDAAHGDKEAISDTTSFATGFIGGGEGALAVESKLARGAEASVSEGSRAVRAGEAVLTKEAHGAPASTVAKVGEDAGERSTQAVGEAASCSFDPETLVDTPQGLVAIQSLKVGDQVYARNDKTGAIQAKSILQVFVEPHTDDIRVLTLQGTDRKQTEIVTSDRHPFHVRGSGWVPAGSLRVGDAVDTLEGGHLRVVATRHESRALTMYNVEVKDFHTYAVSTAQVWVHNACAWGEGAAKGAEDVANSGGKLHRHHSDPKFLGGDPDQPLTTLNDATHRALHKDMNDFLRTMTDEFGNHMRPQRGNSGQKIQQIFGREQCIGALCEFYRGLGAKYEDAAKDFFNQHPGK